MHTIPAPATAPDPAILVERFAIGESGPTVVVKDCIDIAGTRTGCGSAAFADAPPARQDAPVVARLREAGCRIVGKAVMHELAYGVTGINAYAGTPLNPRFPDRIVGGSSSGAAAAVASGMVDFAVGTDTGGSIRMPAACCGVFGLKPTFGRLTREGAVPATSSLDCIGPFADTMAGMVAAMVILDPEFGARPVPQALTLGRIATSADADVEAALDAVLARAGAGKAITTLAMDLPLLGEAHRAGITIMAAEMAALFGHLVGSGKLGADIDARLAAGLTVTPDQVAQAETVRAAFTAQVDEALARCDVLVLPTLPCVPILLAEATDAKAALRLTELVRPFNVSGHPAISLPTRTAQGLPAAVQLVGRRGEDAALCAAAQALEPLL